MCAHIRETQYYNDACVFMTSSSRVHAPTNKTRGAQGVDAQLALVDCAQFGSQRSPQSSSRKVEELWCGWSSVNHCDVQDGLSRNSVLSTSLAIGRNGSTTRLSGSKSRCGAIINATRVARNAWKANTAAIPPLTAANARTAPTNFSITSGAKRS